MKRDAEQGFTLTELLLVLAIVGLLSLGAMQRWQQRQQLRDTAQQLQGFLQGLRAEANWQNAERLFWLRPGERWCLGSGPEPAEGCAPGSVELSNESSTLRLIISARARIRLCQPEGQQYD
ncbi:prepilin-type N-terminal cleavage/methylation domain-containing protein [Candidatus Pantoea persica]|uniref:prepilin-type N-terminal cleavage/methylation domain-containing protein n=1 Tax=Candidatus Pantoea persica TaxID=2518128 RepID=UPI00215D8F92|nr:prepilin-type N-terminal cleavage/methylation domain-containing protein [Candidatus Pantoea persica]MBA2815545.1 prepilin-type N-terminal cleavage/methylation domain-containing protein [Candidatus Pantoea persica]